MHGTPCFTGTRVPVQTLMDFLEDGDGFNEFLDAFPYVPREQVLAFLELSKELALEQLCVSTGAAIGSGRRRLRESQAR